MRSIRSSLAAASIVAASACTSDGALAPKPKHTGQIADIPSAMLAAYTPVSLPGTETVVALNDNGDVVGATATGGVLWHGAAHDRTILPIIPTAIANDGVVAGSVDGHAATWRNGRVTILDTATSAALAICRCESATIVGNVQVDGITHAAIWADGIRIDAGVPPSSKHAEFSAIANGFVVGNAIIRMPNPQFGDSSDFEQPFSWSPAGGWHPLVSYPIVIAGIVSLNSHGGGVGFGFCICDHVDLEEVFYDVPAGTSDAELTSSPFRNVNPTGINDSGRISANADFTPADENEGSIALVDGKALPPGVLGDHAAGINSAGMVAGQSNGLPVLWIPNP